MACAIVPTLFTTPTLSQVVAVKNISRHWSTEMIKSPLVENQWYGWNKNESKLINVETGW